jgi:hypothetical protein
MVYEAGVEFICGLTSEFVDRIQEAVTKIVNAFQAFVDWMVDLMGKV